MDAKSSFFNFEDREECYTSNCMYFKREIHWCTQNYLWTTSFMNQEGLIRNISVSILSILIQSFWSFVTLISLSCMKESTWFLFQMKSMVREIILEPLEVPDLHPRSQEHHWNPTFLIFKIVEGYNQIVCILKDQSIGVLKITYVHHPQFIRNILHGSGKWPDLLL